MKALSAVAACILLLSAVPSSSAGTDLDQALDLKKVWRGIAADSARISTPDSVPAVMGDELQCHYDGDDFFVIDRGNLFKEDVDDRCYSPRLSCGIDPRMEARVAALYDCDELIVYDQSRGAFRRQEVDDNEAGLLLKADGGLAAAYDGDDFFVYDAGKGSFAVQWADDDASSASLDIGPGLAAFYDGDDFFVYDARRGGFYSQDVDAHSGAGVRVGVNVASFYDGDEFFVYDAKSGRFARQEVDNNESSAFSLTGKDGALFYDGDDVFAYCAPKGSWQTLWADRGVTASGRARKDSAYLSMFVGDDLFTLSTADCSFKKTDLERLGASK